MGDHHHRSPLLMQIIDQGQNLITGVCIEISSRFVGQQQHRIIDESTRDGDSLAFSP